MAGLTPEEAGELQEPYHFLVIADFTASKSPCMRSQAPSSRPTTRQDAALDDNRPMSPPGQIEDDWIKGHF